MIKKKKKEKFFLELDEEQGLWMVGKDDKDAPQSTEAAPTAEAEAAPTVAGPETAEGAAVAAAPPQPASLPVLDPRDTIRAAFATGNASTEDSAAESGPKPGFVTNFPLPPTTPGRRGPGPSVDPFKEMARQTKPRI